jgi:hypothetical protein
MRQGLRRYFARSEPIDDVTTVNFGFRFIPVYPHCQEVNHLAQLGRRQQQIPNDLRVLATCSPLIFHRKLY